MSRAVRKLDDLTRDVLGRSRIEGALVFLPGQLERADYVCVDKALRGLGGKWDRKAGAHVFPFPAAELVEGAVADGAYVGRKQALGFFQTPEALAAEMAGRAVEPGDFTLEPSAGHGRLVSAALAAGALHIHAVEIDGHNAATLRASFLPEAGAARVDVHEAEFLDRARTMLLMFGGKQYDSVLMNPPFADGQDAAHVAAAWCLLKPGGRMAAVCSEGPFFRSDRKAAGFREWLEVEMPDAEIRKLPPETFKAEGTGVSARLILAEKREV